jgi:heavy metal efflux system protein
MLNYIVDWSLRNKFSVLLVTGIIVIWSVFGLSELAIDAVPDITNVQVQVNVKTRGLDPENIEVQVTRNLELEFFGLPGLADMRSLSKFGLSQLTLVFEDDVDLYRARQLVAERLAKVQLPPGMEIELAPVTTGLGEVFMYVLEATPDGPYQALSEQERLTELRTIQDYVVKPHLRRVQGVADVDSNGGFVKEIHINFFPKQMEQLGITINHLLEKLESLGISAGGGYIQFGDEQVIVRTSTEMLSVQKMNGLPLGISPAGLPIRLSDVAEVRVDHAQRIGAATHRGKEAVLGTVLMMIGANGRSVVSGVEQALEALKLPTGVQLVTVYTRKFLVDNTIRTVMISLSEGALLVVLVLMLLLGNLKAALLVALAIPLSMLIAIRGMIFFGITGNLMSLGAIDFGLLVDGSVVVIEAILARLALARTFPGGKEEVVRSSGQEVMRPVVAGILLIMAVYLPILTLEGIEGKMFRPMALTVLLALGASLLVTIFLMPVLASMFLKIKDGEAHDTWLFRHAKSLFRPVLKTALEKPAPFFGAGLFILITALFLATRLGMDFIPKLDEADLVLGLTRPSTISLDASLNEQKRAEELIREFPEVLEVFARLGTPQSATDPMGIHLADTFLILEKDRSKWRFNSKEELGRSLIKQLEKLFPATEVSATQPIEMRFNEMLEGSRADISLRIIGPELMQLYRYGHQAQQILLPIRGVESIEQDPLTALRLGPVMDIHPHYEKMAAYGITLQELNNTIEIALAGKTVGSFLEGGVRFPIVLHLDESLRDDPQQIAVLPLELPMGGTIPLNTVAAIDQKEKVTTIARQWGKRYSAISLNISGRDIGSLVNEAKTLIDQQMELLPGYELHWGGQFKNMERANARLLVIVPITLSIVFLVLLKVLGQLGPALILFASIPFAGVGGIFALWVRDMNFSVSAGVGFIALSGVALLNSLVLINVLLKESEHHDPFTSVLNGTVSRLRPVMMTALVAALGFVPMALNTGLGAEVQRPLATVVIGGLVTDTFLTLILLPAAFLLWKRRNLAKHSGV